MRFIICTLFVAMFFCPQWVLAQETYTIGIWQLTTKDHSFPELEAVLTEAYRRAGAEVKFLYLPKLRDLSFANSGVTDGSAARTLTYTNQFTQLVNVPTPMGTVHIKAYTQDPNIKITSLEDLHDKEVATLRGDVLPNTLAQRYAREAYLVDSADSLLALLDRGRTQVILVEDILASMIFTTLNRHDLTSSPSLAQAKIYHILNRKHAKDLLPRLDKAIKSMLEDGTMKRLSGPFAPIVFDTENDQTQQ